MAAGYSKGNSKQQAYQLLNHQPAIMAEIAEQQKSLQVATQYNAEKAMKEADEAMQFAEITGNANAFVKAIELKAKLTGLLIEKHQVHQLGHFEIIIVGIDDKEKSNG